MELTAEVGKGYVPASSNRPADAPIGLIPVDALYSPVRQVADKVENTRVGQELDYDKLTLTVETDGTVKPADAVAYAARIDRQSVVLGMSGAVRADLGCRRIIKKKKHILSTSETSDNYKIINID